MEEGVEKRTTCIFKVPLYKEYITCIYSIVKKLNSTKYLKKTPVVNAGGIAIRRVEDLSF